MANKPRTETRYDVVVIGAGPGGYVCAIRAAQLGLSVALVEQEKALGGTCLNIGCIPSKALLDSSERFAEAHTHAAEHGIAFESISLDLGAMMKRKDKVVRKLTGGLTALMKHNGITVLHGSGAIPEPGLVEVHSAEGESTRIETTHTVLATGSRPSELPFLPFDGRLVVSSTEALAFEQVPERLVVVGAGAIGLELGSVWARLGSSVEVVEMMPQIVPAFDRDAARALQKELTRQGLTFHLETKLAGAESADRHVSLTLEDKQGSERTIEADKVLVAVGRTPRVDGIDLEALDIKRADAGPHLEVDERYRTSAREIYAIGDLVPGPMLAHKAEEEGAALAELLAGKPGHVNYGAIPNVVYTFPELAAVGRSEQKLAEDGVRYRSGRFAFSANGRALAMGATGGWVKILAEENTDRVLGAQIIGPGASDLISEVVTVMEFGGSAEDIARTCHAHPTLSEAVREAALSVDGRAIHST